MSEAKPRLKPLKPREVYVAISTDGMKAWREYPLPSRVVAEATVLNIYEPLNDSQFVLVFFNFPAKTAHFERKNLYIFSYEAHSRHDDTFGLTTAFEY